MTKKKHPNSRAERLALNEAKKKRREGAILSSRQKEFLRQQEAEDELYREGIKD